jgi:hypothetical protein
MILQDEKSCKGIKTISALQQSSKEEAEIPAFIFT